MLCSRTPLCVLPTNRSDSAPTSILRDRKHNSQFIITKNVHSCRCISLLVTFDLVVKYGDIEVFMLVQCFIPISAETHLGRPTFRFNKQYTYIAQLLSVAFLISK